jgi:hypothetical protein
MFGKSKRIKELEANVAKLKRDIESQERVRILQRLQQLYPSCQCGFEQSCWSNDYFFKVTDGMSNVVGPYSITDITQHISAIDNYLAVTCTKPRKGGKVKKPVKR